MELRDDGREGRLGEEEPLVVRGARGRAGRGGELSFGKPIREVDRDGGRLEQDDLPVDERRQLAERAQREEIRSVVLLLREVESDEIVGSLELLEEPSCADRAGSGGEAGAGWRTVGPWPSGSPPRTSRTAWPLGEAFSKDIHGGTRTLHPDDVGIELTREERMMLIRAIDMGGQFYARQNSGFEPFTNDPVQGKQY